MTTDEPTTVRTTPPTMPAGPYAQAMTVGKMVYVAGQVAFDPATQEFVGDGDVEVQTRRVIANIEMILEACGTDLSRVVDVMCILPELERDFSAFNEVYRESFTEPFPARTTIRAGLLPGCLIEIKVVALRGDAK